MSHTQGQDAGQGEGHPSTLFGTSFKTLEQKKLGQKQSHAPHLRPPLGLKMPGVSSKQCQAFGCPHSLACENAPSLFILVDFLT